MRSNYIIIAGALSFLGAAIGIFWLYVGAAVVSGFPLAPVWYVVMYVTCPMVIAIWLNAWLVPICNGLLYGFVGYRLQRFWERKSK
jgi:hypothetical protein